MLQNAKAPKKYTKKKAWVCVILAVTLLLGLVGGVFWYARATAEKIALLRQKQAGYDAVRQKVVAWLAGTQLENGALVFYPSANGEYSVNPYYACYTALAMLNVRREGWAAQAKAYFDWHFVHLNAPGEDPSGLGGTVFDYRISDEGDAGLREQSTGEYDSADSYAALFLVALHAYVDVTGDIAYLLRHSEKILSVMAVLDAITEDGLSIARPDYPVIYLMDNTEVLRGYKAAVALLRAMEGQDSASAQEIRAALANARQNLAEVDRALEEKLYHGAEGYYAPSASYKDGELTYDDFEWATFYPDAVAQLFPIITGAIPADEERAQTLYNQFCTQWDWENLQHQEQGVATFYWCAIAYCAAIMGDEERLDTYLAAMERTALGDFAYPVYNAEMAWLALACGERMSQLEEAIVRLDPFGWVESKVTCGLTL